MFVNCVYKVVVFSPITVAGHIGECSTFEVGGKDCFTSVHLPLHRLLAGLNNYLPTDVNFHSSHFSPTVSVTLVHDMWLYSVRLGDVNWISLLSLNSFRRAPEVNWYSDILATQTLHNSSPVIFSRQSKLTSHWVDRQIKASVPNYVHVSDVCPESMIRPPMN